MIEFKRATTDAEVQEIIRLRYDVYVEEMQVYVDQADHDNRTFTDAHDDTDRLLYAREDGELIGAISLVCGADAPFSSDLRDIYDIPRFEKALPESKMGAAIRLVVRPEHRSSTLPFRLMSEGTREFVSAGTELLFCTCQPHLLNLYHRLGFSSYGHGVYNDPQFGIMVPLVLVMGDLEQLKKKRSPLFRFLARGTYSTEALTAIYQAMGAEIVHQPDDEESAGDREAMRGMVEVKDHPKALFFHDLTPEEIEAVTESGHIIECHEGDKVIKQDQVTRTLFIPLSGHLEVRSGHQLIAVIGTGEMLGELTFLLGGRRTADVVAGAGGTRVLSFDERNLKKLLDQPSDVAVKLWRNMGRALALRLAVTTKTVIRS